MTKLLLPVKKRGLETPRGEIDTCHTHTHTLIQCVYREYLLLAGGSFHVGDQTSELTEGTVFRLRFDCRLCRCAAPHPGIAMCLYSASSSSSMICPSSPAVSPVLLRSGHSPALPHHQVPNAEVVSQWDDDEEGVQGSEVGGGHR